MVLRISPLSNNSKTAFWSFLPDTFCNRSHGRILRAVAFLGVNAPARTRCMVRHTLLTPLLSCFFLQVVRKERLTRRTALFSLVLTTAHVFGSSWGLIISGWIVLSAQDSMGYEKFLEAQSDWCCLEVHSIYSNLNERHAYASTTPVRANSRYVF